MNNAGPLTPRRPGRKNLRVAPSPFISTKLGQFTYFAQQVGEMVWHGKNVLDFGGNIGNILRDPNCTIDEERYWCIDVVRESVEQGRALYPGAHWLFYDRFCFFFNPHGVPGLPPEIKREFDYIVAYSVFTNTPRSDMPRFAWTVERPAEEARNARLHLHRSLLRFLAGTVRVE